MITDVKIEVENVRLKVTDVKIFILSDAYAVITHDKGKLDVKLAAGKPAADSLLESAAANKAMAEDYLRRAELMEAAAQFIKRGA